MADKFLDTSGLVCPLPILKTKVFLKQIGCGETLEIVSTDKAIIEDMQILSKQAKFEILSYKKNAAKYIFVIKKT